MKRYSPTIECVPEHSSQYANMKEDKYGDYYDVLEVDAELSRSKEAIKELVKALNGTVYAMKRSLNEGCTDHLDASDDAGKYWYKAEEKAVKLLSRLSKSTEEDKG